MAESMLSTNNNLSKLFYECKDYVVATCQGRFWSEKVDDLCQVGFIRLQDTDIYEIIWLDQKLLLAIISVI